MKKSICLLVLALLSSSFALAQKEWFMTRTSPFVTLSSP